MLLHLAYFKIQKRYPVSWVVASMKLRHLAHFKILLLMNYCSCFYDFIYFITPPLDMFADEPILSKSQRFALVFCSTLVIYLIVCSSSKYLQPFCSYLFVSKSCHLPISVIWPPYHSFFWKSSIPEKIRLTYSQLQSDQRGFCASICSRLTTTPVRPYLPVRPIRCQKVSPCLTSNSITRSNFTSMPLASRSEAIITLLLFIWFIIRNRAAWLRDPWIRMCSSPTEDRYWDICYKNDFFYTNIRHF